MKLRVGSAALVWALFITLLHVQLNIGWAELGAKVRVLTGERRAELRVGFLPVTCHLTCPVTNWITTHSESGSTFRSHKFTDFATVKEALISEEVSASFILARVGGARLRVAPRSASTNRHERNRVPRPGRAGPPGGRAAPRLGL